MAINLPKEIREREQPTVVFGLAVIVAVFLLAVWPGFLKTEQGKRPGELSIEKYEAPDINFALLVGDEMEKFEIFEEVPLLSLDCLMIKTKGSPDSEEDCQKEAGCFWNQADGVCYRLFEKVPPLNCPMGKTGGRVNSEKDCQQEPACLWNKDDKICYRVFGSSDPFSSHLFLLY